MFKKTVFAAVMMFFAVNAFAASVRPYIGIKAGVGMPAMSVTGEDMETGTAAKKSDFVFSGSAALGVKICALRAELEYTYKDKADFGKINTFGYTDPANIKQQVQNYMFNVYFDFPTEFFLKPYINAGAGWSQVEIDSNQKKDINLFAYNVGLGVSYEITSKINLDLGYRYTKTNDWMLSGDRVQMDSHDAYVSARYTF